MTELLSSLSEIYDDFDVAVLDQWGVLHDGSTPYAHAAQAMRSLADAGKLIFVLSNSGKRADLNLARIKDKGLPVDAIAQVVTSGEALWEDLRDQRLKINGACPRRLHVLCGNPTDAAAWASGADQLELVDDLSRDIDAVILMGVTDGVSDCHFDDLFSRMKQDGVPLICSNPDRKSPRSSGLVTSPGLLADRYQQRGGQVIWYGKPEPAVFRSVMRHCPGTSSRRIVMVGDSLQHDVQGAHRVGVRSVFVRAGLHAPDFASCKDDTEISQVIEQLAGRVSAAHAAILPDYSLPSFA